MGRSYTPPYACEVLVAGSHWTPAAWRKEYGRPTAANLAKHVKGMEESTQPGGCNEHLGPTTILAARILRNRGSRDLVAGYLRERTSAALSWALRGIPNDPEGIEFAYADGGR